MNTSFFRRLLPSSNQIGKKSAKGFSTTELVLSAGAGALLIVTSGAALQSTGTQIKRSESKSTLRQNSINGIRLMRSEVERSMHLIVNRDNKDPIPDNQAHTNLQDARYTKVLDICQQKASDRTFKPIFGVKMDELNNPVIYGMSIASGGYNIERCGAPLEADGRYNNNEEGENLFLSPVLSDIGAIPCPLQSELKSGQTMPAVCNQKAPSKKSVLEAIDFTFKNGKTESRTYYQPGLRVQTDENFKLIKFIDPTEAQNGGFEDKFEQSFIMKLGIDNRRTMTYQPLHFTAFARADKRINNFGEEGNSGSLSGAFFQNITSSHVRFVIDGSGSMSACVMWSDEFGPWKTYYSPSKKRYVDTRRVCALTRMEALISEMTMILRELPNNTKIGITAFSSNNYTNHKSWDKSNGKLARIGDEDIRDSAINFVNTLDDKKVTRWGGTDPWRAITEAFEDEETDTLYLMSDGQPNKDRWSGSWSDEDDNERTANYFSNLNNDRKFESKERRLIVNSTSLGLESTWMKMLSQKTQGYYNRIDKDSIQGEDKNETS